MYAKILAEALLLFGGNRLTCSAYFSCHLLHPAKGVPWRKIITRKRQKETKNRKLLIGIGTVKKLFIVLPLS
jgi:hypothetical protein